MLLANLTFGPIFGPFFGPKKSLLNCHPVRPLDVGGRDGVDDDARDGERLHVELGEVPQFQLLQVADPHHHVAQRPRLHFGAKFKRDVGPLLGRAVNGGGTTSASTSAGPLLLATTASANGENGLGHAEQPMPLVGPTPEAEDGAFQLSAKSRSLHRFGAKFKLDVGPLLGRAVSGAGPQGHDLGLVQRRSLGPRHDAHPNRRVRPGPRGVADALGWTAARG